jgi:hypothetical protein
MHLIYRLRNDHIQDWLIAGPIYSPIRLPTATTPVERTTFEYGEQTLNWRVDHSEAQSDGCIRYAELRLLETARITVTFEGEARLDDNALASGDTLDLDEGDHTLWYIGPGPFGLTGADRDKLQIRLPTDTTDPIRRKALERAFAHTYLDRSVLVGNDTIILHHGDQPNEKIDFVLRLQKPNGRIYAETLSTLTQDAQTQSIPAVQMPPGPMQAVLIPRPEVYYGQGVRAYRVIPFYAANDPYYSAANGEYGQRAGETLSRATVHGSPVWSEYMRMTAGWWDNLRPDMLTAAIDSVRLSGDVKEVLGLVAMLRRYGDHERFPADIKARITACFENVQGDDIPSLTVRLLGRCETVGDQITAALTAFGQNGKPDWHVDLDTTIAALVLLVDLAEDDIADLAAVLLDKLLFQLAYNHFAGVFAAAPQFNARIVPETGINYLLWGTGCVVAWSIAPASLLSSQNYPMPKVIQTIAADPSDSIWAQYHDQSLYKTLHYALFSASTHWQAILGPDAIIGGKASETNQWDNALNAHTTGPISFPVYVLDDYKIDDQWAYARAGDVHVTLHCPAGLALHRNELHPAEANAVVGCVIGDEYAGDMDGWLTRKTPTVPHIDTPYCQADSAAETIDIVYGDDVLRLNFA